MSTALTIAGSAAFTAVTFYLAAMNLYLFGISLFGVRRRHEPKILVPERSFAIIVPAHQEEQVIAETVRSILSLDYPRELYELFVVADHCSDATAERAAAAGATVLVRDDGERLGKPAAVRFGMDSVLAGPRRFDAVVIVDADNLVSRNLLLEFNSRLLRGEKVIQAYLDTKNPDDTWITWMYAVSYWIVSRYVMLAPAQIGLPAQLGGTGYCVDADVLRRYGWDVTSLTDDLEYTMRMVLNGINPTWAHDAVVYDEKPLTMKASLRQRLRWMQGHWDVAARYTWPLLRRAVRLRSLSAFHAALYCLAPTRTVLWAVSLVFAWFVYFEPDVLRYAVYPYPELEVAVGVTFLLFGYPMLLLVLERVPRRFLLRYFLMPVFAPTWVPVATLGFFRRRRRHWDKTEHTRAVAAADAESVRGR